MNLKFLSMIILLPVLLIAFISIVRAEGIVGASPGVAEFNNVLRGGYAERYVTITIDSENPVQVNLTSRGNTSDWFNFSENISVSRDNLGRLLVSVEPPSDIPNGNYTSFLRISPESIGKGSDGRAVSTILAVIDIVLKVEITDVEIFSCGAKNFLVQSAEKGDDIIFTMDVSNSGNIRIKPTLKIDMWDQEQISIVKSVELKGDEILPTKEGKYAFRVPSDDLPIGQYWAEVSVPDCYSSDTLTFDVLEPGALKADGILLRIFSTVWTEIGETVPIVADFENVGQKEVEAQFRGRITRDGQVIQVLESEKSQVPVSEITNFTFYFTPKRAGKYIASGRVFYDKKRTFESSTVINVTPKRFDIRYMTLTLVYISIFVFIAVLVYKIRKEKKRYLRKLKGEE
jgi:hypothetical protein